MTCAADRDAFATCFTASWPRVCRYLRSRGTGGDTHDLASEVFTQRWQRWQRVSDDPLPRLLRTARYLLANHERRQPDGNPVPAQPIGAVAGQLLAPETSDVRHLSPGQAHE